MITKQIIEKNGQIEWTVIHYEEYQKLVVYTLLDGENPIRVW
jgi:hypothetical protein